MFLSALLTPVLQRIAPSLLYCFRVWALGVLVCLCVSVVVIAAPYPHRPISLVVTFPPGGGTDLLARKLSERLADYLPEPVIVENKPGASGNIGARQVAQALPDGHTLLMVNSTDRKSTRLNSSHVSIS